MSKTNKVIIQVCLCGAGTKKDQAPTVPYYADELAEQIIACAKAGASVAHIHVREDKEVGGKMEIGYKSMSLQKFTDAVETTRKACKAAGVDKAAVIAKRDKQLFEVFKVTKKFMDDPV